MEMKNTLRKLALLLALAALPLAGCDKVKNVPFLRKKTATPAPVVAATPAPVVPKFQPEPEVPLKPPIDTHAQVVVLCYHRLEGKAGGGLSIEPALFEKQMQDIKDAGLSVISMQDFLAWRRGDKSIPPKSVLITIDDGYLSGFEVGVPVLKKFGYPATFFIYTTYLNSGGKSLTWAQLAELRDSGFEIGSHTVSHLDLKRKPAKWAGDYDSWLKDEVERSKKILEDNLGIKCATIAYPFGLHNAKVQDACRAAGYEAGFTTYGARLGAATNAMSLGRYDVTTRDVRGTDSFTLAITFSGMQAPSGEPVQGQDAAVSMITEPVHNSTITDPKPLIKANLSTMGALDPGTVEMRVSGLGLVGAQFDPATKMISFQVDKPLKPGAYTVIITAKSGGRRVETRWTFSVGA